MRHVAAVFEKQWKDTFKNKTVLIQFLLFPVMAIIMENAVQIDDMPEHYFVKLFATMYIGMAPLTCMAGIISEEKEKNTLRVLLMSNVKPTEYLVGIGGYVWLLCMCGALVMAAAGGFTGKALEAFLLVLAVGILTSLLIGAAIGTWSKNQMMATSVTVPVMMIFAFLPMLSMFNETISRVAKYTYSQQINLLLEQLGHMEVKTECVAVILCNIVMAAVAFGWAYRKSGLA